MKHDAYAMTLLFDYYGELLTEKQKTCFDLYYNQDLSLAEIAEGEGISRQGVHDTIGRAEALLLDCERAAGCVARQARFREAAERIGRAARGLGQHPDASVRMAAEEILAALSDVKE